MNTKKVEIYSTENCHFCHMAKDFFKSKGIQYTDYDVGTNVDKRAEMIDVTGQMGVPVIVVDGKDVVVGFNEKALSELLGLSA